MLGARTTVTPFHHRLKRSTQKSLSYPQPPADYPHLGNSITIDNVWIKSHLDRVVRGSVEETLNAPLDAEADLLCNAQCCERSEARRDTRAGHHELETKADEVKLRIPKLRTQTSGLRAVAAAAIC
jgi:hypothetical protein